ncbi:MAG: hypothetical protein L0Y71_11040 [Gemmataceae bacterium]|nr:hypothetical protein [Gemmataceae bacterium]
MADSIPRRVIYSQALLDQIKALAQFAHQQGRLRAFAKSLASVQDALEHRPLPPVDHCDTFGEARFPLRHLGLLSCGAAIAPVAVHFSVSMKPQNTGAGEFIGVYVTRVELME